MQKMTLLWIAKQYTHTHPSGGCFSHSLPSLSRMCQAPSTLEITDTTALPIYPSRHLCLAGLLCPLHMFQSITVYFLFIALTTLIIKTQDGKTISPPFISFAQPLLCQRCRGGKNVGTVSFLR